MKLLKKKVKDKKDELMENDEPHDVRLVYLACAWLMTHRGHFLSNISMDNLAELKEFRTVYDNLMSFFEKEKGCELPWNCGYSEQIGEILKNEKGINTKYTKFNVIRRKKFAGYFF